MMGRTQDVFAARQDTTVRGDCQRGEVVRNSRALARTPDDWVLRWQRFRSLAIQCAILASVAFGCGGHQGGGNPPEDGGGSDGDDANDDRIAADTSDAGAADVAPSDTSDGSSDVASSDGSDGGDGGRSDLPDICVGLGKVEDPRGCSGASICDGAGKCISRFTVFPIERLNPSQPPHIGQIAVGSDGNLWFGDGPTIGRMTPTGDNQEFAVPGDSLDLARGPDGNLWFTDQSNYRIGRVTIDGTATEFPAIAGITGTPAGIVTGPDDNVWFADLDHIVRMTTGGTLTMFPVPISTPLVQPYATWIATGADGNLWFTEQIGKIGRITPAGVVTEFPIPETGKTSTSSVAFGIAAGPDGNLWFAEPEPNKIGRITPVGAVTEFSVPRATARPTDIATGPDGNLWFVENLGNQVGRITPAGVVTEFALPTPGSTLGAGIIGGPDGGVWFTEYLDELVDGAYPAWVVRLQP